MFDFVNYTYNGVLSILSTLFGLSYPLILSCIEKIDTKYCSTKLSARFGEERVFILFKYILILNLIIAVVFPFLMDGNHHSRYLIAAQCVMAIVMIYYAFLLFNKVMTYYDAAKLQEQILADYHKTVKAGNKALESKYFTQWSDLTLVLLSSADEKLVQSVYEEWYDYVIRKYNTNKGKPLEMDDYFYDAVTRINENLCKGERKPISVNNSNSLLTSLIVQDSVITEKTYRYLWKNLRLQLFYERDEWVMAYWKTASQRYDYLMTDKTTYDVDERTGNHYTERQVEERNKQREQFAEFHIMLCAMLLQQGKYELLEQMMFYTQSQPPTYPLVPSNLADILKMFEHLNEYKLWDITYYEERYPMPNMHGITGGKILGAANCYMALLVYRLYVLIYPYGREFAFRTVGLSDNQAKLAKYKRDLDTLRYWLEKIKDNKEALSSIRVTSIDEIFNACGSIASEGVNTPEQVIKDIQNNIEKKLIDLKQHQPNDPEKIGDIEKEVNRRLMMAMSPISDIWGKRFERDMCYYLNSSVSQLFESTAFQANPDISHAGVEDCVFEGLWHTYSHLFASSFYQECMQANYTIDSGHLFDALDKVKVSEDYYAFAFGIYIDYYIGKVEGLVKETDRIYNYNRMKIMSLDCPVQIFSKRIYIMRKDDKPYIEFQEPSDEQKKNMELKKFNKYDLWMSVQKVEGHENVISEEYIKKLGNEKDLYSVFHAMWIPKLYFKERYKRICLKVNYKMTDEGSTDSIEIIEPFEVPETDRQ